MEDKKTKKISISTFLLFLAIIALIVMGIFIYKISSDKSAEEKKSSELQSQVNSLNGTVSDLQGKINDISENINSNTNQENKTSETESSIKSKTQEEIKNEATKTNTAVKQNTSAEPLYFYSSGDNAAAKGNPELLYVYELSNNTLKFKYHTPWNEEDIEGPAKSTDGKKYVYENGNKKLEILLNSMGEDSVKVTEYENNSMTSYKNLFK